MHVMHRVVNASEKNGSFPGRLAFFFYNNAIFCLICLVVIIYFVYLQTERVLLSFAHLENINA